MKAPPITSFVGEHKFLSNFYPWKIEYEGIVYPSSEHAYQAAKSVDRSERLAIAAASSPGMAKKMGQLVVMRRVSWDPDVKIDIMRSILRLKFATPFMSGLLLGTRDAPLVEGNTWGDRFWGVCRGQGENHLGRLLMEIREEIRQELGRV
jgi:ribA/ribD-fused uncharacterized protein